MSDLLMERTRAIRGQCLVYFMQPVEGGPVKIGTSRDIAGRHTHLQSRFRKKLVILKVIPGSYTLERYMKKQFKALRFKGTEQFKPGAVLMNFVGHPERIDETVDRPLKDYVSPHCGMDCMCPDRRHEQDPFRDWYTIYQLPHQLHYHFWDCNLSQKEVAETIFALYLPHCVALHGPRLDAAGFKRLCEHYEAYPERRQTSSGRNNRPGPPESAAV